MVGQFEGIQGLASDDPITPYALGREPLGLDELPHGPAGYVQLAGDLRETQQIRHPQLYHGCACAGYRVS